MLHRDSLLKHGGFGAAWLALCGGIALHVAEEALTGFLSVYNPTVLVLRERFGWWFPPTFEFGPWLAGLITLLVVLLALAPAAFAGARWLRPIAYVLAGIMLVNGIGHIAGTIAGRTVAEVSFERPMPGFYSSPLLMAVSLFLLRELQRSRRRLAQAARPG